MNDQIQRNLSLTHSFIRSFIFRLLCRSDNTSYQTNNNVLTPSSIEICEEREEEEVE